MKLRVFWKKKIIFLTRVTVKHMADRLNSINGMKSAQYEGKKGS